MTGCWPRATSSRSTAARSSTAGTATPRSPSRSATVPAEVTELMRVTEEAMWRGIAAARLGGRVTDISHAVETHVRRERRYGILEDYVGHGIGSRDAPAAQRAQLRPARARPQAGPGPGARRRADGHPRRQARRVVLDDDWTVVTGRRLLGGPLRAHVHPHARRRVGAHRARRRRAGAHRARRPVRRLLSRVRSPGDSLAPPRAWHDGGEGGEYSRRGVVVSTARTTVRPGAPVRASRGARAEETSGEETTSRAPARDPRTPEEQLVDVRHLGDWSHRHRLVVTIVITVVTAHRPGW